MQNSHSEMTCGIAALTVVRLSRAELAELRKQANSPTMLSAPRSLLRHTDDQTIAGITAVSRAIEEFELPRESSSEWGFVGCARLPGRSTFASSLEDFRREGARGTSMQIIPNCSQHSLSGTLSLLLNSRKPNFGVGGGFDCEGAALMAASTLLATARLPMVWCVLAEWTPEPDLLTSAPLEFDAHCIAAAFALVPSVEGCLGRMSLSCCAASTPGASAVTELPQISKILELVAEHSLENITILATLPGGLQLDVEWQGTAQTVPLPIKPANKQPLSDTEDLAA